MLDINYIRDHQENLKTAIADKQFDPALLDQLISADTDRRRLIQEVEALRHQANKNIADLRGRPSEEQITRGREIKQQLQAIEPQLAEVEKRFIDLMYQIPNPAASDVPVGSDESGNVEIKKWGTVPQFDFPVLPHEELAESLDLLDTKRAVRIAGNRAFFTKNDLVLLEYGLLMYALKMMIEDGYTPMTVPWMVGDEAMWGTGYFPWGQSDHYSTQDGQRLIGTAEVPLTAYYKDEILSENQLPLKMVGISPCYRREVGSYGKDTKGIFRVHQFNKVEQVVYTIADESETRTMHDQMLGHTEKLLQSLKLPYRVLLMCTGDMGAGQRRKYDVEVWFPSQNTYRETHSDSYFNDFQSRRLNIRYQSQDGTLKYVYTLNNTVVATPRIFGAILENYQQADGSVKIPAVLVPFMGKDVIKRV